MTHPAPPPPPPQVDYFAPDPARRRGRPLFSVAVCIAALIPLAVVSALLMLIVPHFESVFADFGVQLPAVTMLLLDLSLWFRHSGWLYACGAVVTLGFLAPLLLPADPRAHRLALLWLIALLLLATLTFAALAAAALYLPFRLIMQPGT